VSDKSTPDAFSVFRTKGAWGCRVNPVGLGNTHLPSLPSRPKLIESQRPRPEMGALVKTTLVTDDFAWVESGAAPRRRLSGMAVEAAPAKILSFFRGGVVCVLDDEASMWVWIGVREGMRRDMGMKKGGRRGMVLRLRGNVDGIVRGTRGDGNTGRAGGGGRGSVVGVLRRNHDRRLFELDRMVVIKVIVGIEIVTILLVLKDGVVLLLLNGIVRGWIVLVVTNIGKSGPPHEIDSMSRGIPGVVLRIIRVRLGVELLKQGGLGPGMGRERRLVSRRGGTRSRGIRIGGITVKGERVHYPRGGVLRKDFGPILVRFQRCEFEQGPPS